MSGGKCPRPMKIRHVHHCTFDKLICAISIIFLAVVLVLVLVLKDIFQVLVLVIGGQVLVLGGQVQEVLVLGGQVLVLVDQVLVLVLVLEGQVFVNIRDSGGVQVHPLAPACGRPCLKALCRLDK